FPNVQDAALIEPRCGVVAGSLERVINVVRVVNYETRSKRIVAIAGNEAGRADRAIESARRQRIQAARATGWRAIAGKAGEHAVRERVGAFLVELVLDVLAAKGQVEIIGIPAAE